jgi:ribosome-binding ATPase YchF (GTP1/OBG family)
MSRYIASNRRFLAEFGWDPPLRYFFLTVYELENKDGKEEIVFDNLSLKDPGMDIEQIRAEMKKFDLDITQEYEEKMKKDSQIEFSRPRTGALKALQDDLKKKAGL